MTLQFWISVWFKFAKLRFPLYRFLAGLLSFFLAGLVLVVGQERRTVMLTNLRLCFPNVSSLQRFLWGFEHLYLYLRTFLDRGWVWSGNHQLLADRVILDNPRALEAIRVQGEPVIFLAPHFLGLDAAWSRLSLEINMVTMYSNQKNPVLNEVILKGRQAYGDQKLLSRQEGIRPLVQSMKKDKRPLYYLPDMDFGEKDSVFVPFFKIQAATVTAVARLSKLLKAKVVPVTTRFAQGRYIVTIHPALPDFPKADEVESTRLINQAIEGWVEQNVPQYLWTHKRFKTRPVGETKYY